jgi:hypothetical protein
MSPRRGLAPLELVFALPILLFIMALMVNFGVVASWKVRGSSVSRFEAWRARHERAGSSSLTYYNYPQAESWWPPAAQFGHGWAGSITVSNGLAEVDPNNLVPTGSTYVTLVDGVFEVASGLVHGWASLERGYVMLGKIGGYDVRANTYLVDDKWQFHEMGLSSNNARRIPVVYDLTSATSTGTTPAASNAYIQTATNLFYTFYYNGAMSDALAPLDESMTYQACGLITQYGFLYFGQTPPDFHPRLQRFCTLDTATVDPLVDNLIDRIQGNKDRHIAGVAECMAHAYIALYRLVDPDGKQPQLQRYIKQLEQFLKSLSS